MMGPIYPASSCCPQAFEGVKGHRRHIALDSDPSLYLNMDSLFLPLFPFWLLLGSLFLAD